MTENKKHILVVSQYFYPEQFRINDICREWVEKGHKVTVLTGIPNYPQGKYYKGYGLCHKRTEEWEGVSIIRIPLIPRGHMAVGLILNYLSFVISGWVWKCVTKVKVDIVYTFEVSPMTQALVGVWYAKKHRIPHYLYVQDLWPESVETIVGIHSRFIVEPIEKMVAYIYKNSNHIFATSPSFVKEIQKKCNNQQMVTYWPQYAETFYHPVNRVPLQDVIDDESFKIVFTGNIGYAQGLDILPKTAVYLKQKNINCSFYIIGSGRYQEKFEQEIREAEVQSMFYMLGRKKPEEIPYYMAHFDMAFLSFSDNHLFEMTIPAKLQTYMACGLPILAVAGGETRRIIEEAECGICCERQSERVGECIDNVINKGEITLCQLGRNGRNYCEEQFKKDILMKEMDLWLMNEI